MGITHVSTVSVFVSDQHRAKKFYTEVLGLELRSDNPLYPGSESRWIAVAPVGGETEIILNLPDENWEHYEGVVGKAQSITLEVKDMTATHKEFVEKGVKFVHEPEVQPWGHYTIIEDSEANKLIVVEQPPD